jgi:F-type H+-transporting ATPase subunit gamma
MAGSYNSNVIKEVVNNIGEGLSRLQSGATPSALIYAIGRKAYDFFARRSAYEILGNNQESLEEISFETVGEITSSMLAKYDTGDISEISLTWTSFKSAMEGEVKTKRLLPLTVGNAGGDNNTHKAHPTPLNHPLVDYEPSPTAVIKYLVPKFVQMNIYSAIVEAAATEHASRHMAMENATDNANDMIAALGLFYNRARQSAITKEITEIAAGAESMK